MSVGIDVSKDWLDVAIQIENKRVVQAQFANTPEGWRKLHHYVQKRAGKGAAVCLEATGSYWRGRGAVALRSGLGRECRQSSPHQSLRRQPVAAQQDR